MVVGETTRSRRGLVLGPVRRLEDHGLGLALFENIKPALPGSHCEIEKVELPDDDGGIHIRFNY